MRNPYIPELALIEEVREETPEVKTFKVSLKHPKPFKPLPGQFIEVSVFGYGEFLVSVSNILNSERGVFEITVKRVGYVTSAIHNLPPRSVIGVRGPFGNGFPIEKMKGKNILMIAGGTGISVIKSLIHHLLDKREEYGELRLLYGAKTPKDLVFRNTFLLNESEASKRGLTVTLTVDVPDEGWRGNVGTVVDLLHKTKVDPRNTIAVVCGPSVMMKVATEKLLGMGFDENSIIYSFERRMQCGIGICGHCMLGEKYVCLDGPIFTYAELRGVIERIF